MYRILGLLVLSSFLWVACSDDDRGNARIEVRLTDAPGDYEKVNIDIQAVEVHSSEGEQSSGWTSLTVNKGVYNLIDLTNGLDTLLAEAELPAGKISQIRLILGSDNSVQIDGNEIHLTTPSGSQSGLKLNVQTELTEGITYKILLDFDAARSIVKRGNGDYNLKPVIRAITEATSGAIKGAIDPAAALPAVFAIVSSDTVASTFADEAGNFLLRGVPAGTYTVSFDPKEGYTPQAKEGVSVSIGAVTDLGTVTVIED